MKLMGVGDRKAMNYSYMYLWSLFCFLKVNIKIVDRWIAFAVLKTEYVFSIKQIISNIKLANSFEGNKTMDTWKTEIKDTF